MHEALPGRLLAPCPWEDDKQAASQAAQTLGIPFAILNAIEAYQAHVVRSLIEGYAQGNTPNPDALCNQQVKFGFLLDYALSQGFDALATGHYCVRQPPNATYAGYSLWEGADKNKDQSYFLCLLQQAQIAKALFPLGELQKTEVRRIARELKLPNAERKDSQGICFLAGKVSIQEFLRQYLPDKPGPIETPTGKVLGEHLGLHHFTLGQRKGIKIPSNQDHQNYVVVGKDPARNALVVALESIQAPGLYTQAVDVAGLSFTQDPIPDGSCMALSCRPRYRDPCVPVRLVYHQQGARVIFASPQRALAPGQVLAFYEGERLLGGGYLYGCS
jgi:tRNA-specific 2-thiouridylase